MFGIRPAYQRQGLGRRLMCEALGIADDAGVPAYLYTSNSDNLPYYRSHGYEVTGESDAPRRRPQLVHGAARRRVTSDRRESQPSRLELAGQWKALPQ